MFIYKVRESGITSWVLGGLLGSTLGLISQGYIH